MRLFFFLGGRRSLVRSEAYPKQCPVYDPLLIYTPGDPAKHKAVIQKPEKTIREANTKFYQNLSWIVDLEMRGPRSCRSAFRHAGHATNIKTPTARMLNPGRMFPKAVASGYEVIPVLFYS